MNGSADFTKDEKTWGTICHLSTLCVFLGIPLGNIIAPLVIWVLKKEESTFVDHNGREALNFQISMTIYCLISAILIFAFIGSLLIFVVLIADIALTLVAAIKTSNGQWYRYPATIRFVK